MKTYVWNRLSVEIILTQNRLTEVLIFVCIRSISIRHSSNDKHYRFIFANVFVNFVSVMLHEGIFVNFVSVMLH